MKRFFFSTYFIVLAAVFLSLFGVERVTTYYVEEAYDERIFELNQELSKGTFALLEARLLEGPEEQFLAVVERLQPDFGYPIEIHKLEDFVLKSWERKLLLDGDVVVREDGDYHLMLIGDTSSVVSMGPFKDDLELKPLETTMIVASGALVLGFCMLIWTFYFWRKLKRLSDMAMSFGEGDLSARVPVSRFSSLSSIGATFNSMADQIEQLISSHKQLVNAVSHELRTPISRIKFSMDSLRTTEGEEWEKQLRGMNRDVVELEELVTELLSYSRFERSAGQMEVRKRAVLPWLRSYMALARETFDVELAFHADDISEELQLGFNSHYLERAIHNLIQNGTRFADTSMAVTISASEDEVEIRVEDDGPGIAETDRQRVFEPFVRLDSSRNRESGGYGLGLSIVHEIIKSHGGTIHIEQAHSGGAMFLVTLPR